MRGITVSVLKISIITPERRFGTVLNFRRGLNLLCGNPVSGKTTCLKAILYTFGLEKMIGREGREMLPPVLRSEVIFKNEKFTVLESFVELEVENHNHETVTLRRQITGEIDPNLIAVCRGPVLSRPAAHPYPEEWFCVRSQNPDESLFQDFLNSFIGWNLPLVPGIQGGDLPLPLETIFPLFFIDQRSGWRDFPTRIEQSHGVQHPGSSAFEFLLCLDVAEIARKKRQLLQGMNDLKREWAELEAFFKKMATDAGGGVHNFPAKPILSFEGGRYPGVLVPRQNGWVPLREMVSFLREEHTALKMARENSLENISSPGLFNELKRLEKEFSREQAALTEIRDEYFEHRENIKFLQDRVEKFDREIESFHEKTDEDCFETTLESLFPSALGSFGGGLTEYDPVRTGKSSQMNLLNQKKADLQEQRQAAQLLYKRAYRDLQDRGKVFEEKKFKVSELKKQLFRLRKELNIEEGEEPNQRSTDLTKKEETILKFVSLIEKIDKKNAEITKLSKRWKELLSEQARFQKECHSTQDKEKLKKFLTLFFEKARLFGFTGLHLKKLKLSLDSYQPILDNFDLSSDLSGSDHVRLIWAYHIALLETATFFNCNHPGFLVLDEPAQQNVGKENLKVFIRHLSKLDPTVHQIIAATSGNASDLQETLGSETIHWIDLGENSFPPLSE